MEYCTVIKSDEFGPFVRKWMHLKYVILSKINQTHKLKFYIISLIGKNNV